MKRLLVCSALILTAALAFAQAPTPYATGYKDAGFKGESEKFLIGEYPKMQSGWKDEIKSIALTGAIRVTLFDKEQFEGKKLVVEGSMYELSDLSGEAASMKVEAFTCEYATAYKNTIYRGNSKQFSAGKYEKLQDGWDDMQSIDLCGAVTATLYQKENFEGESVKVSADRIDLGKFNKKVKSMVVEAAAAQP
jgi:hypothetical protein